MSNYIIWCCDYNKNTGEGRLAEKFISSFFLKKESKFYTQKTNFFLVIIFTRYMEYLFSGFFSF